MIIIIREIEKNVFAIILQVTIREVHVELEASGDVWDSSVALEYFFINSSVGWSFYPNFYNTLYTDFFPPARGVERRARQE